MRSSLDLTLCFGGTSLNRRALNSSARELQEKNFREYFPTGDYADYEPIMQKKLAEPLPGVRPPCRWNGWANRTRVYACCLKRVQKRLEPEDLDAWIF